VVEDGHEVERDINEIAVEVGEKALGEWGKQDGEIFYAKRAPKVRYDLWKKLDLIPVVLTARWWRSCTAPHGRGPGLQEPGEAVLPRGPG